MLRNNARQGGRLFFKPGQGILPHSVSGAEQTDRAADQIVVKHVGGVELTVQLTHALIPVHGFRQRVEQVGNQFLRARRYYRPRLSIPHNDYLLLRLIISKAFEVSPRK